MNAASKKVLKMLMDTERVADQVLQNKQEIIELDKRRQSTREAIRDLGKNDEKSVWITIGPILVKMEKEKACGLLKKGNGFNDMRCFSKLIFFFCFCRSTNDRY